MDSLIFDVDGTLWDAVHNLSLCWNETAALYNYPLHSTYEDIKALMGRTTEQIAAALFPDFSKEKGLEVYMVGCSRQLAYLRELMVSNFFPLPQPFCITRRLCKMILQLKQVPNTVLDRKKLYSFF